MTIKELLNNGGRIWLILLVLSIGSFVFAEDLGVHGDWGIAGLLLIAFVKARLIIQHFMEVNHAPLGLRITFDIWNVIAPVGLMAVVILGERGMLS